MRRFLMRAVAVAATACAASAVAAQTTQPPPGPTRPPPTTSPLAKPGTDMVINPTTEECRAGWNPSLKWTQEQFDSHCAQMKASR